MRFASMMIGLAFCAGMPSSVRAEDPVFSGPQVGEQLPSFTVRSLLGETVGQDVDIVKQADGKPVLLVFYHARTRPAFGLANMLVKYAASRKKDGLHSAVVFLTEDPTEIDRWMPAVKKHFHPESTLYGVSSDGIEGPGSYGLNRNMNLTILVGNEGKVTGNFALVQPSVQADGPKILKAIVDATGGGEVPTLESLDDGYGKRARMMKEKARRGQQQANDPKLDGLLRSVIRKGETPEEVKAAVAAVEEYVAEHEGARAQLGIMASRVVNSGKLSNYPENAHDALKSFAKKYGPAEKDDSSPGDEDDNPKQDDAGE